VSGGIYQFTFARTGGVSMHGMALPPAMGVTTALNFPPAAGRPPSTATSP
jgi:hypothetical protein